jgi:hypothetical protein
MNFNKRRTCGTEFLFEKPVPQKMVKTQKVTSTKIKHFLRVMNNAAWL